MNCSFTVAATLVPNIQLTGGLVLVVGSPECYTGLCGCPMPKASGTFARFCLLGFLISNWELKLSGLGGVFASRQLPQPCLLIRWQRS